MTTYTVRRYTIVPPKPFKTLDQAVQYIQEKYPELDKETIEKYINPSIKENGTDKSGNTSEKAAGSPKTSSKAGTGGIEEGPAGKD
ncbi:hypothetical protein [Chryseobacterium proteolyticum]|uniref:hypothetical protein n=1 Tax=Chryseobacterium proteolyticum TaxID=118127 RepID=UPI003983BC5E